MYDVLLNMKHVSDHCFTNSSFFYLCGRPYSMLYDALGNENVARFCYTVGTSWYLYENEIRQLECLLTAPTNTTIQLIENPYSP